MLKNREHLLSRIELAEREFAAAIGALEEAVLAQDVNAITNHDTEEQNHLEKSQPTVWVSSGKLSIQQGLMCLRRAIHQPESL